jgi:WD40 repeat protein
MNRVAICIGSTLLLGAVSSCIAFPPIAILPVAGVTPVAPDKVIAPENAKQLSALTEMTVEGAGPIAALIFQADGKSLSVAYANENRFRRWDLATGTLTRSFEITPITLGGASFDASGGLLATSAGALWDEHKFDDDFPGYQVWDTVTATNLLKTNNYYNSALTRHIFSDVRRTPDGRWLLTILNSADDVVRGLSTLVIRGVATGEVGDAYINFARRRGEDDFNVVAFDASGEYFAAADEAGKVAIFKFLPPRYPSEAYAVVRQPDGAGIRPLALAFDRRRHWLAMVRGDYLTVWDLQANRQNPAMEVVMPNRNSPTASLAFNPAGDLLAIGSAMGWQLWDVAKQTKLAEHLGTPTYAVAFNRQGHLFGTGDDRGVVTIWGLP